MITWKDFVLDDAIGPYLDLESCESKRLGGPCIMEDAVGKIQETGQEARPARMVGIASLDSNHSSGMEAARGLRDLREEA